jgi:hypothetical protein
MDFPMPDQDLSITAPSIAKSSSIATIGNSWSAVGPTGTAGFELPVPTTAGRGYDPQLTLRHNSNSGNGPFGVGWGIDISRISRRTNKGVPRYTVHDEIVNQNGEVCMAELDENGDLKYRLESTYNGQDIGPHKVVRYWPRIEIDFALCECWQRQTGKADEPVFWLVHGADGSLLAYGMTGASRLADPDDASRVSAWLLCESMNARGEHICYEYKADDAEPDPVHDYRAQRYLRRVCYGNVVASNQLLSWTSDNPAATARWYFQLLFDFGERGTLLTDKPEYASTKLWPVRDDAFLTHGQGFELGTRRRCHQVLMFHHFPDGAVENAKLARRLLLEYGPQSDAQPYSLIRAAHYQGFNADGSAENSPPVEFEYSAFSINKVPQRFLESDKQNGIEDGRFYSCIDLWGEGLPGLLCRYDQAWYYRAPKRAKPNTDQVDYEQWQLLEKIPVANRNSAVLQMLTDQIGSGRLQWVTAQPGFSGFRELTEQCDFSDFMCFDAWPTEFFSPQAVVGDFGGDGLPSMAIIASKNVRYYQNLREEGFAPAEEVAHDDDDPLPVFSNSRGELVMLGNLIGSDIPGLCRIRHDRVDYWPSLGHGKFGRGRKISELPFNYGEFDSLRVRLADIDGSGAPALIYLKSDVFEIYLNCAGNGFIQTPVIVPWPTGVRYDSLCHVIFADLQGLGCATLILTVTHMQPQHWRYDFVSAKPYQLIASNNNMGCSTRVTYRSSAQEWLDEKRALLKRRRLPVCRLPFAVSVVKQQQQLDEITGNCLTRGFTWQEGYYDSREREFRGFGHVQQTDSEAATINPDPGFSQPVRVLTWYHTGRALNLSRLTYFKRDAQAIALGKTLFTRYERKKGVDKIVKTTLDAESKYQIARALVGSVLRSETYADTPRLTMPYLVVERRYLVREVRPQDRYAAAVLLPMLAEEIEYQYDGFVNDPLCRHSINLLRDAYGSLIRGFDVSYARRLTADSPAPFPDEDENAFWRDAHDDAQQSFYLRESRARFIDLDTDRQKWRLGLPYQQRENALVLPKGTLPAGLNPAQVSYENFTKHQDSKTWLDLHVLITQSVQRYVGTDGKPLNDGEAGFEALSGRVEVALLDKTALDAYSLPGKDFDVRAELKKIGYTQMPFLFGIVPRGSTHQDLWSAYFNDVEYHDSEHFHHVRRYRETLSHGWTSADYDPFALRIIRVELPDGCVTQTRYDDHHLLPREITDANENVEEVNYDASGQPMRFSFYGSEGGAAVGFCPLSEYIPLPDPHPEKAIANPEGAVQRAASTLHKDLFSWMGQIPPGAALYSKWIDQRLLLPSGHIRASARRRLTHGKDLTADELALLAAIKEVWREPVYTVSLRADRYPGDVIKQQFQMVKACVDGFGRSLQTQQLVDPGEAYEVDPKDCSLLIDNGESPADPRWRISERVEYNNKGLPTRQYRPFFANRHCYVNDRSLHKLGLYDETFYDPLGRVVKVLNAKGYFSRETHHPWYRASYDFNDTAEEAPPSKVPKQ